MSASASAGLFSSHAFEALELGDGEDSEAALPSPWRRRPSSSISAKKRLRKIVAHLDTDATERRCNVQQFHVGSWRDRCMIEGKVNHRFSSPACFRLLRGEGRQCLLDRDCHCFRGIRVVRGDLGARLPGSKDMFPCPYNKCIRRATWAAVAGCVGPDWWCRTAMAFAAESERKAMRTMSRNQILRARPAPVAVAASVAEFAGPTALRCGDSFLQKARLARPDASLHVFDVLARLSRWWMSMCALVASIVGGSGLVRRPYRLASSASDRRVWSWRRIADFYRCSDLRMSPRSYSTHGIGGHGIAKCGMCSETRC